MTFVCWAQGCSEVGWYIRPLLQDKAYVHVCLRHSLELTLEELVAE